MSISSFTTLKCANELTTFHTLPVIFPREKIGRRRGRRRGREREREKEKERERERKKKRERERERERDARG